MIKRLLSLLLLAACLLPFASVAADSAVGASSAPASTSSSVADPVIRAQIAISEYEMKPHAKIPAAYREVVDPRYSAHDFAACFEGISLSKLRTNTEDAVFGYPIDFIIITGKGAWLMGMNNVYGVLIFRRAQEVKPGSYVAAGASRAVYLPALYDRLRAAGVNILSEDELLQLHRQPVEERKNFMKQYRKVKP